jgi:glutathione S-transferase
MINRRERRRSRQADAVAIKVTLSTKGGGLAARRNRSVIEVYAFSTPNSVRVPIALEELGLDYELKPVNVKRAEQKSPDFLALNPNGKVPVLIDPDGPAGEPITLTEFAGVDFAKFPHIERWYGAAAARPAVARAVAHVTALVPPS